MMSVNSFQVCLTCLSCDRVLYPVKMLDSLLRAVDVSLINIESGICWECKTIMYNFLKFKTQVIEAQETLSSNPSTVKSLSRLKIYNNTTTIIYKTNDLLSNNTNSNYIKQEMKENKNDESQEGCQILNNKEYPQEIEGLVEKTEDTEKYKNNMVEISIKMEQYKNKYTMVMYTKEDLIKIQDEKRNHPNYKKVPFKCDLCVLGFNQKESFNIHMNKKHNKSMKYSCDICHIRFPILSRLERHKRNHYITFKCNICKYETKSLTSIKSHCKIKHINDTFGDIHCKQCSIIKETSDQMVEHIRKQHSLICNVCGDKFSARDTLRRHILRMHTTKRDFICDQCKKTFKTKHRLETHMVTHNSSLAKKLAYCNTCNVQYKNIYIYRQHLRNSANHSEKSLTCVHCHKNFSSKTYLQQHNDFYHLKKSRYVCDTCDKSFISKWRLTNHKQVHHGFSRIRNHSCETCGKKFYDLRTLLHHQKIHSDQRSYMCEDCGDTFKQSASLYTHIRLVHKMLRKSK